MNRKRGREGSSSSHTPVKKSKIENDNSEHQIFNSAENKSKMTIETNPEKKENLSLISNIKKIPLKPNLFQTIDVKLNTITKIHQNVLNKFKEIKQNKDLKYNDLLNDIIEFYDVDEDINEYFLEKLYEYYKKNKEKIDKSKDGESDILSQLFFKYIYSIPFKKRIELFKVFDFFKDNELFRKDDKKFFHYKQLETIFRSLIEDLKKIFCEIKVLELKKTPEKYLKKLDAIFTNYQFQNSSFKIPIKFGNSELIYINLIIKLQSFFCKSKVNSDNHFQKIFNKYDIKSKIIAFDYFQDYFELKSYDILSLLYICFCLYTFFIYYDGKKSLIESNINEEFFECSRFLYQKFDEKLKYIKEISEYIKNDIDINKMDEKYFEDHSLKIKYKEKEVEINVKDCYFLGDKEEYLDDLINGKAYNFEYLRKKKFPLFLDESLNNDFISYVNIFLKSDITKEYLNNLTEIESVHDQIFTDEIIQEINNNSLWVKFPIKQTHAITERDTFTIFLNNNLDNNSENKFINILSSKVITCGHEDSNHVIRLLMYINSYNVSKKTPRYKNLYKDPSFNKYIGKYNDQGDMWEHILFGNKITNLFIMGGLFILDPNNFNSKIKDFKKQFKEKNQREDLREIINQNIRKIKENKNNTLSKYIREFNDNDFKNDSWLKNDQKIVARNNTNDDYGNSQAINFGFCGTHGFD